MSRKFVWLVCMVLVCCLGACQLAKEEAPGEGEVSPTSDRMIGVYITVDNPAAPEKTYAEAVTYEEDGHESITFIFEGIPGIAFFHPTVMGAGELDSYMLTIGDREILDGETHISVTMTEDLPEPREEFEDTPVVDNTLKVTLKATLNPLQEVRLYVNYVYQASQGDVYMLSGPGYYIGGGEATVSVWETSQDGKYALDLTLKIEKVDLPQQVVFKELNAEDEVICTTVITPENIPDAIALHPQCAYTIVETHSLGAEGTAISRILLAIEEESYTYKYPGERGFLVSKLISIQHPGE